MRSIFRAIVTLSAVLALSAAAMPAIAGTGDEASFVASINQSRAAAGLAPLTAFWDLTDDARVHTAEMMAAGQIYHSSNSQLSGYSTGWALLGENVGMGPNPTLLHQAFMNSSSHRANILGDYNLVGVGAETAPDGKMFVTVVFMKSAAPAPTPTTTPPTTTPPTTAPPTTAPPVTAPAPTAPASPAPTVTAPTVTAPPATAPPVTNPPVTAPPTTQPVAAIGASDGAPTPQLLAVVNGARPAARASSGVFAREVGQFRSMFGLLDIAGNEPLLVHTSNGVPVTIE